MSVEKSMYHTPRTIMDTLREISKNKATQKGKHTKCISAGFLNNECTTPQAVYCNEKLTLKILSAVSQQKF